MAYFYDDEMSDDDVGIRKGNFPGLYEELSSIKQEIKRLYKQVDGYDDKYSSIRADLELLRRANKEYELKVRDYLDVFDKKTTSSFVSTPRVSSTGRVAGSYRSYSGLSDDSRSSSRSGIHLAGSDYEPIDDDDIPTRSSVARDNNDDVPSKGSAAKNYDDEEDAFDSETDC
ncbi:uncharacterized protein LOC116603988 isoform X2 [Nematostella vectensis]|uniref:uncharacterized protein LOC116603988 isoform X2 n=1 Tax=Nematostella vectensis TaxID=45351 RepID=UPI00138FE2CD|nr:uncharacterized protein LOC116603988 isoform X2 [Nematostella vectensis]